MWFRNELSSLAEVSLYLFDIVILVHGFEQDNVLYFVEHWNKRAVLFIETGSQT